jgi:CTP:molybdopterin cytidylyltransferase MocA
LELSLGDGVPALQKAHEHVLLAAAAPRVKVEKMAKVAKVLEDSALSRGVGTIWPSAPSVLSYFQTGTSNPCSPIGQKKIRYLAI